MKSTKIIIKEIFEKFCREKTIDNNILSIWSVHVHDHVVHLHLVSKITVIKQQKLANLFESWPTNKFSWHFFRHKKKISNNWHTDHFYCESADGMSVHWYQLHEIQSTNVTINGISSIFRQEFLLRRISDSITL